MLARQGLRQVSTGDTDSHRAVLDLQNAMMRTRISQQRETMFTVSPRALPMLKRDGSIGWLVTLRQTRIPMQTM